MLLDIKGPFVIAELSGNHGKSFNVAKQMIYAAYESGVDAIKLQTYTPDTMTLNVSTGDFLIGEQDSLWKGRNLYDLYGEAATPWEWHKELFDYAKSLGLIAFSSPFDLSAVQFLESLEVPLYKVASFELTDLPLVRAIAKTGKPTIMSTGMASIDDIQDAVNEFRKFSEAKLTLLKCTSTYPARVEDTNLLTIPDLAKRFGCDVGLSDHTRGIGVSVASIALGATVIEKHFVLDRTAGGVDAEFSMEPAEMKLLVDSVKQAYFALGSVHYGGSEAEQAAKKYRRSIYIAKDIKAGMELTSDNIRIVRPSLGLAPKHWDEVLGRKVSKDLQVGQALSWDLLE
ncbi:pseudaminic acid synthase [Marinomonas balearica]|uniref:N-acetylneuraminate synthase n=1 Tax=Marinomonas balearica TaxID=491947 RepID=A0A4R6M4J3_9GAMM|nr:pseudaminic acid synthase [Marinomonas balearica]TDO96228.1 N-acetylneuraminate synthase [Marinomonas balearica]